MAGRIATAECVIAIGLTLECHGGQRFTQCCGIGLTEHDWTMLVIEAVRKRRCP
jgi:hypothetical protein